MKKEEETPKVEAAKSAKKPSRKTKMIARILVASVIIGLVMYWNELPWKTASKAETASPTTTKIVGKTHDTNTKKAIELGSKIEALIAEKDELPEKSPLSLGFLGKSQESTSATMNELLESLAIELGSSRSLGSVKAITQLRDESRELEDLTKSQDPTTAANAKTKLDENLAQQQALIQEITKCFEREGIPLTQDQVSSLCMSPNAEDTTSLISAFSALKAISVVMEERLRTLPTQDMAQQYYGSHCVMLLALDRIQKQVMEEIVKTHIPKTEEIIFESDFRIQEAQSLLNNSHGELSLNEQSILKANQQSCKTTAELASKTKGKLEENLKILLQANNKLQGSIATAQNSHATAMLQKEILQLARNHTEEINKIQSLTIPELAAINFADPSNPRMSPRPNGRKL